MAVALCIWLLWWQPQAPAKHQSFKPFGPLTVYSKALAAIALLVFCGVASWNYHLASQIYLDPEQRDAAYRDNTLAKTRHLWLFDAQVRFAELTITDVSADNAPAMQALALDMLHFSPETRVVEKVMESALVLGQPEVLAFYAARLKAAFPSDYARWQQDNPSALTLP